MVHEQNAVSENIQLKSGDRSDSANLSSMNRCVSNKELETAKGFNRQNTSFQHLPICQLVETEAKDSLPEGKVDRSTAIFSKDGAASQSGRDSTVPPPGHDWSERPFTPPAGPNMIERAMSDPAVREFAQGFGDYVGWIANSAKDDAIWLGNEAKKGFEYVRNRN
jgi:hypothetical protein